MTQTMGDSECEHDGCNFPAQFRATVTTTGTITGVEKRHESAQLCQYHTNVAADSYEGSGVAAVEITSL